MKKETNSEEKKIGRNLLRELDKLIYPVVDRGYVDFSKPRTDRWLAFRERWGLPGIMTNK